MPDIISFVDATHVKQVLPFLKLSKKNPRNYMQFKNITNENKLQEKKTTNLGGKLLLSSFFATLGM